MLSKAGLVPGGSSYSDLSSWLHFSFLRVGDIEQKETQYIQALLHFSLSSVRCQVLLEGPVLLYTISGPMSPLK